MQPAARRRSHPIDYIIVGAGSAGSTLSYRLAERGHGVAVIEAGGEDWSPYLRVPAGIMRLSAKHDWNYPAEPDPSRNNIREQWNAGKVLGGGSSVNAMTWVRGHPGDFDSWAYAGCHGWNYQDVLGYFKRAESFESDLDDFRGSEGPQQVSRIRVSHPMIDAFVKAAEAAGYRFNEDYNGKEQSGVSYAQASQKNGLRHSTARAYLSKARRHPGLQLVKRAVVTRVLIENGRAVGVEYRRRGRTYQMRCAHEVILSAGAIGSPKLLMLSGIGPADDLRRVGVDVVTDSPGVGANLQEHPHTKLLYEVNVRTLNRDITPAGILRHGLDFALRRRGALTSPLTHAMVFEEPDRAEGWPLYGISFVALGVGPKDEKWSAERDAERVEGEPKSVHDVHSMHLLPFSAVTAYPVVFHPRARGRVTLRSSSPLEAPVIEHSLMGDDRDVADLTAACRRTREIFSCPPMRGFVVSERLPGPTVQNDREWATYLRGNAIRGFHVVGTCRMGGDDVSVVDPQLRVRGVESLRVIDASVMPTLTSGNTNSPTVMIAERGADLVTGDQTAAAPGG